MYKRINRKLGINSQPNIYHSRVNKYICKHTANNNTFGIGKHYFCTLYALFNRDK